MLDLLMKVVENWHEFNLADFDNGRRAKTGWDDKLRKRYSRWLYIIEKVKDRARNYYGGTSIQAMRLAAASLEENRIDRGLSIPQLYDEWKSNDPSTKRRRSSTGESEPRNRGG
jgi:hypothetical protein